MRMNDFFFLFSNAYAKEEEYFFYVFPHYVSKLCQSTIEKGFEKRLCKAELYALVFSQCLCPIPLVVEVY